MSTPEAFSSGVCVAVWACYGVEWARARWRRRQAAKNPPPPTLPPPPAVLRLPANHAELMTREEGTWRWLRLDGSWMVAADDIVGLLARSADQFEAAGEDDGAVALRQVAEYVGGTALGYDLQWAERERA